jgi:hypothetical protein
MPKTKNATMKTDTDLSREAVFGLLGAPTGLRAKLRRLIETSEPYVVLTGSTPDIPGGCCPSDAVGAAESLVRAGLLEALRPPSTSPGECPVTLYAFAGEIRAGRTPDRPRFTLNRPLRERVLGLLKA